MKFTQQRFSKVTEEMRFILRQEEVLLRIIVAIQALAFLGIITVARSIQNNASTSLVGLIFAATAVGLCISMFLTFFLTSIKKRWEKVEALSTYDDLTGAVNRNYFEKLVEEELRRAGRYRYPLSLCYLDIDGFRLYNQTFGPREGDQVLRQMANLLKSSVRFSDTVCYFGKDEFCVMLPHTDVVRAEKFLARMLLQIEEQVDISFSAGVTAARAGETKADFLSRAHAALEVAKKEGSRRIRCLIHDDNAQVVLSF